MTSAQTQAFYMGSGIHAAHFSFLMRLTAGLLIITLSVLVVIGLMKLLEDGAIQHQLRFIIYLIGLATTLMLFFTFVTY